MKCPNCNFVIEWENPKSCPNCTFILQNYCTNPECRFNPENDQFEDEYMNKNFNNFKYCPECGEKTYYFELLTEKD